MLFTDGYEPFGGLVTLVAGSVAVADTKITANSIIECGTQSPAGTVGAPFVGVVTAGTGFTLKSTSGTDTSVLWYRVRKY